MLAVIIVIVTLLIINWHENLASLGYYECGFKLVCLLCAQALSSLTFQRPHKKFIIPSLELR